MKAIVDTDRTKLERLLSRIDALEGYPVQYPRASGKPSPKGQGITRTAGRVIDHPTRGEYALHVREGVLKRHDGKDATPGPPDTVTRPEDMVDLDETWKPTDGERKS